jgi:peptidyl-prolyl cis-trans isomerase SurA
VKHQITAENNNHIKSKLKMTVKKIHHLTRVTFLAFAILCTASLSYAQKSLDKEVLVNIGNEAVTVDDFMRVYDKNNSQTSMQDPTPIAEYLDLFVNFKLKVMEAEELKMDTNSTFQKELAGYREQLAKPYFIDESVNEALLEQAYQRKLKDVRASHILIMVDENARPEDTLAAYNKIVEVRELVVNGMPFEEAAVEYSDDPSAKDREEIPGKQRARPGNKGDLGYFTVFNMVYPFENAAYETPVGEISQPTRTRFGYHLIKVNDKKDALGTAQVAHIFVPILPGSTSEDSIADLEKINNIYQKIQEGMPFEEAVVEYSEDKGSAKNGGELSKFTCNRVVPEFVIAAESLQVGEVSEPVQTMYGYHILKLISRETPGTFEEESPKLKERLAKDERSHKSEEAVISNIKNEYKFKVYDKAKAELFAAIDTSIISKTFAAESVAGFTKPLMKLGSEKYTQYNFAVYAQANQKMQTIDKGVYLEQLFNQYVAETCLAYEDKHLEEKYPEFKALMEEYHDGILLFNLTDEKVWSKAVKDTTGLEQFFNAHRDNYMWGERLDATIFEVKKTEAVDTLRNWISRHMSDGEIAKKLDEDSITSVKIIPGLFEKGDNKIIDQVDWVAGTTVEVNSDVEELTVIIRIREILPPEPKKLNEARGLVTADYQTYLEKQWIEQLKEKYPVQVNQEILDVLVSTNR